MADAVGLAAELDEPPVVDEGTGEVVAEYEREWGSVPTDSSDPVPQLSVFATLRLAVGTAVGILDQNGTGRKPHVQHRTT